MISDKDNEKRVHKLCVKLVRIVNDYMDTDDGESEAAKMTVLMTAVTKVLAAMTVTVGVPEHIAQEALRLEMEAVLESMAEDITKH